MKLPITLPPKKNLLIFDVDGTLTNTVEVDDCCYTKTIRDLYDLDLRDVDWSEFPYVTDLGILRTIFSDFLHRELSHDLVLRTKRHFHDLLLKTYECSPVSFSAIPGAKGFIKNLSHHGSSVAIATGGWEKTARFKLNVAGFNAAAIPLSSADDHYSRSQIVKFVIEKAAAKYDKRFERFVYFGDGAWDLQTCKELDIEFVGIDFEGNGNLRKFGVKNVFKDFHDLERLTKVLN